MVFGYLQFLEQLHMDMICEINFRFPADPSFPAQNQCDSGQESRDIPLQTTKENSFSLYSASPLFRVGHLIAKKRLQSGENSKEKPEELSVV